MPRGATAGTAHAAGLAASARGGGLSANFLIGCPSDVAFAGYQTVPANQQFVDVTNAGFASIDVNACSFAGFNVLTETTIGAATVALSGTLAPGEIFRIGSAGVSGVDAVIADGALPAGPGGLSLLDAAPPADGTSVGAEFPDNITGIVYLDNETIFGVAHLRVPAHNAIYDCIYGGGAGASFDASNSTLVVTGDGLDNNIEVSRDGVGNILVNGGATPISGGTPTVANTNLIVVCGQNGNDTISLNEVSGALPQAQLRGGVGNDTLIGGSGNDVILGESGNDLARGGDGEDNARGGTGNDTLLGDRGNDSVFGDDGSDLVEGGSGTGTDTQQVNGANGAGDDFSIDPNGARVRFQRNNLGLFTLDIGTTEDLDVNGQGGGDVVAGSCAWWEPCSASSMASGQSAGAT